MKKLITILTIMIVLIGAVFATDPEDKTAANATASIDITASVVPQAPRFTLSTTGDNVANVTVGKGAQAGLTTTAALTDDAALALSTGADTTVAFSIKQSQSTNIKASYTVTVTATEMLLTHYLNGNTKTAVENNHQYLDSEKFVLKTSGDATPDITIVPANNHIMSGNTEVATLSVAQEGPKNQLTVNYKGSVVVGQTPIELGTFDVEWKGNAAAVAGDYKATVTMVVTAL